MSERVIDNNLARYSRAGDEFHYRWAARRCLKLIYPNSELQCVKIEGSKESKRAGEYVIDVAEYYSSDAGKKAVNYFQLKHSTKHADQPFRLCDLKGTMVGFSRRYSDMRSTQSSQEIKYYIVSNRPFSDEFRNGLKAVAQETEGYSRFRSTISKYTNLTRDQLKEFCSLIELVGGEGDYRDQRSNLRSELQYLLANSADNSYVDSIVALVREHALPDKTEYQIKSEDILKRIGVSSKGELFPAPPKIEELLSPIKREQHDALLKKILEASTPIIIHASGGVGKSIIARQLVNSLPDGSVGIVYDCFAAGEYRNPSQPRHRHRDALVQIVNEIAAIGLCDPLLPLPSSLEDALLRSFSERLKQAASSLRESHDSAVIAVFIDAADNAEMAAIEAGHSCFARDLLRMCMPEGCRVIELCRSERIQLLEPRHEVGKIELEQFSSEETLAHLRKFFPDASELDGIELCRLSGGNPRVQANALNANSTLTDVLQSLGPEGTSVNEQIALQLQQAVEKVKGTTPPDFQGDIDSICHGLAILPPYVPIRILADVASVQPEMVKSFITDMGHPFLLSDNSVQFRDEPTESWFRETFSSSVSQVADYVVRLEPLASHSPYVARVLPSILLLSGKYDELIRQALSDSNLPDNNPIEKRDIRVYRLQFAFKAALKKAQYADAVKIACLAGEEVSGTTRQLDLLRKNIDLIKPFQSQERVQELAFRRLLHGAWQGSENVYSASILSTVEEFKGEARSFLRSARNWLDLYFDERKKLQERSPYHDEQLEVDEIVELVFAQYNLLGSKKAVDYLLSWSPKNVVYKVTSAIVRRLIDAGNFEAVNKIVEHGQRHPYLVIAIAHQLIQTGRFPSASLLQPTLVLLCHKKSRIELAKSELDNNGTESHAIFSFLEACIHSGLSEKHISRALLHYAPKISFHSIDNNYPRRSRDLFLRFVALRACLDGEPNPNVEALAPETRWAKNDHERKEEIKKFTQIVGGLLPWYLLRIQAIAGKMKCLSDAVLSAKRDSIKASAERYMEYDPLPFEISSVHFDILSFADGVSSEDVETSIDLLLHDEAKFRLDDRLAATRATFRLPHLSSYCRKFEVSCRNKISASFDEHVEEIARYYVVLSRAVLSTSPEDAACYFNQAIEVVSRFGDEVYERWDAVMAIAERVSKGETVSPQVTYRFLRCAEMIGKYIDREKNFDRDRVVKICSRLHSPSAFTGLSRWRDRDVGRLYRQMPALIHELVEKKLVAPSAAWSMSAFEWEFDLVAFAKACIEKEARTDIRQYIFNAAVRDLRLLSVKEKSWEKLESIADQYSLKQDKLVEITDILTKHGTLERKHGSNHSLTSHSHQREPSGIDWNDILNGLDLTDAIDLDAAISRFDHLEPPKHYEEFWPEVFKRVAENDAVKFLKALTYAECADSYDVEYALSHIPDTWCQKVSVQRAWPDILRTIGQRFSSELTSKYKRRHFLESIRIKIGKESELLFDAVLSGLAASSDLATASTFFNFVEMISPTVPLSEAIELLEFSLERFEAHIEDDFADGPWGDWLMPPSTTIEALTGFIWAGLGAPRSSTRWEAAHCIRRLAETKSIDELDSLISWTERGNVEAYLGCSFPFYELHARLYLLISLARVALDFPELLKKHNALFADYALNEKHVLIQKYASDIARSLETAFPGTYENETMARIKNVNVSRFPVRETNNYHHEQIESPWHERGEVDKSLELYFGYDFDRYWFNSLEHVFGLSVQQIEELAREVVLNEWEVECEDKHVRDPRRAIYRERETWHSHFEYPKTDDYSFYISYHAMFTVTAKLIQEMPVLSQRDWHEDEWNEWIDRHALTRSDGRWLADRRDPSPLERRSWLNEEKRESWRWEIMPEDFLDGLLFERDGETWLNVFGSWSDNDERHDECIRISSALVASEASPSLLNALSTFQRCHDYKLPNYKEDDFEFVTPPFSLHGWIVDKDSSAGLDKFDPFAADIIYPPYQVGDRINNHFDLQGDIEKRTWRLPSSTNASLICEIWSDGSLDDRDSPVRHGRRLGASLEFMLKLSSEFNCEIIIEIQIERHVRNLAGRRDKDEFGYTEPYCKLYLLSQDGRLRDTAKSYQLGKEVGS